MSEDRYTDVKTTSYFGNVKKSLGNMIIGLILFIAAILILWFNEGNYATKIQMAAFVNKNAIPVENTILDKTNDNKLISTSGKAITNAVLTDGIISVPNALALKRTVEMYQWEEEKDTKSEKKLGGETKETTTYQYKKVWSEHEINSSNFYNKSYSNPKFTIYSERYNAQTGQFGAFNLSSYQTSALKNLDTYTKLPQNSQYKIYENYYYKGNDINAPNIGDIRISYSYVPSGANISVIGLQRIDKTITPMISKFGNIYIQYDGMLSQAELVEKFKKSNLLMTNIFRILGFLIMFIGLNLVLQPLAVVLSFIPIFEKLVSALTGGLVFMISAGLSLIIIAIAWLFFRPLIAICLLFVIVILAILIKNKITKKEI